jgi:hypothetical protein
MNLAHEIAGHREDKVGVGFEHPGHKLVGRLHRDLGRLAIGSRGIRHAPRPERRDGV